MALPKIDWQEVGAGIVMILCLLGVIGITMYAISGMSPKERDDFIFQMQQEQLQLQE